MTKIYIVHCEAHDETDIQSVWLFEQEAIREAKRLQDSSKSKYETYYVEGYEVRS